MLSMTKWVGAVVVGTGLFAGVLQAQTFALYSPAMVKGLRGQRDTDAAKAVLNAAAGEVKETPHPMARVHTEGTLPHQGIRDESIEAERDLDKMQNLAFAYRLTGDTAYLAKASEFMDAWVSLYKVSGNPIDETRFEPMVVAFDLTRGVLKPELETKLVAFFRGMSETYLDWLDANFAKDPYNWSSHRVKLAMLGALESGDRGLMTRAANSYSRQVHQNIRPDGSVNDFYKRDALHYVTYDLEPLEVVALAVKAHGQDCFHTAVAGKPSLEMGVDWLVPFATGQKTHEEFKNSSVKFDAARANVGEKGYSGQWEAGTSANLFAMATWLDPKYAPVAAKLGGKTPPWVALGMGAAN